MKSALFAFLAFASCFQAEAQPGPFSSVSAASYVPPLAPGSIAAGFGTNLSNSIASASSPELPTTLAGVSVDVVDSASVRRAAPLYFVSPQQINYVVPDDASVGAGTAEVRSGMSIIATGPLQIAPVAPSLFTANASGRGIAAGLSVIVETGGNVTVTRRLLAQCTQGICTGQPITWPAAAMAYLELYGTGIRGRTGLAGVRASIGGTLLTVLYAGPQSEFPGLDQINLEVPAALANTGIRDVLITVDGQTANTVAVQFGDAPIPPRVSVRFDPSTPDIGPFPTDFLTIADARQKTGLRVNLPLPDCGIEPTTCETYARLNEFDGFNLEPRLRVRFSAPVDPASIRQGVGLVWLNNLTNEERGLKQEGHFTRSNRGIFDPATNTFYAEPDEPLDQHRRYALVVTEEVRDALGNPVQRDPAFTACLTAPATDYCRELAARLPALEAEAGRPIVAASLFTTLSATSWIEKARSTVRNVPPNFTRTAAIGLSNFASATLRLQTGVNPARFEDFTVPLPRVIAAGTDRVVFGSVDSPNFLDERRLIETVPTGAAQPVQRGTSRIAFHVFVPSSTKPASGYPVAIFGHGLSDSAFGAPTLVAGRLVRQGFAMVVINAVGHGSGPQTTLVLTNFAGAATTVPVPGRGVDLDNNGEIGSREGCLLSTAAVGLRDCLRQTAVDLMQITRLIRQGLDLDGDGTRDLDPGRIYYAGQSLGALYGTLFTAVEPDVRAAAFNAGGGSVVDIAVVSDNFRSTARDILAAHVPPLLNRPPNDFDANIVFRDQPVRVNAVPGGVEIQNYLDLVEWLQMPGDPIAFAPHLKLSPLPGVPEKRVLFQIARGDRTVPNPANSNLIRHAGGLDTTVLYRHDIARSVSVGLSENPHAFLVDIRSIPGLTIAGATQQQIAGFLNADGTAIPEANTTAVEIVFLGRRIFERPAGLPEDLGFTP